MRAKIVRNENLKTFSVLGTEYVIRVSGSESTGAMVVAELRMPPGAGIPRHVHTREDEVFQVLERQIAFTLDDHEVTVGPETTVFGPRGVQGNSYVQPHLRFTPRLHSDAPYGRTRSSFAALFPAPRQPQHLVRKTAQWP